MNRRNFLKYCTLMGLSFPLPTHVLAKDTPQNTNTLILIELQGGNDGLNTVIPYNDPLYYEYRPTIAIPRSEVIELNTELALHPSLTALMPIWAEQNLSIVLGIGYPNPSLSHFRSIEIWNTASKSDEYLDQGWLTPVLNQNRTRKINGLVLGGQFGPLTGTPKTLQIRNINQFLKQSQRLDHQNQHKQQSKNAAHNKLLQTQTIIDQAAATLKTKLKPLQSPTVFGKNPFAQQMALATQIIQSNLNIPVIKVKLGSFDTHANQKPNHAQLLKQLADNIYNLSSALKTTGHWHNTTLMTYSEFGRRVKENGSKGTDHGTAAPHFIIGGKIQGGLKGEQPKLDNLIKNNLQYTKNFNLLFKQILTQVTT